MTNKLNYKLDLQMFAKVSKIVFENKNGEKTEVMGGSESSYYPIYFNTDPIPNPNDLKSSGLISATENALKLKTLTNYGLSTLYESSEPTTLAIDPFKNYYVVYLNQADYNDTTNFYIYDINNEREFVESLPSDGSYYNYRALYVDSDYFIYVHGSNSSGLTTNFAIYNRKAKQHKSQNYIKSIAVEGSLLPIYSYRADNIVYIYTQGKQKFTIDIDNYTCVASNFNYTGNINSYGGTFYLSYDTLLFLNRSFYHFVGDDLVLLLSDTGSIISSTYLYSALETDDYVYFNGSNVQFKLSKSSGLVIIQTNNKVNVKYSLGAVGENNVYINTKTPKYTSGTDCGVSIVKAEEYQYYNVAIENISSYTLETLNAIQLMSAENTYQIPINKWYQFIDDLINKDGTTLTINGVTYSNFIAKEDNTLVSKNCIINLANYSITITN